MKVPGIHEGRGEWTTRHSGRVFDDGLRIRNVCYSSSLCG